jgi:hypothetical protein
MVGFLGTVIALERAIALGGRLALLAPVVAALATLSLLASARSVAPALLMAAPLLLAALCATIARRQLALHTIVLTLAAAAWAAGNALYLSAADGMVVAAWWFAFLVLTVAAERLELTRLMRPRRFARALFRAATALVLCAAAIVTLDLSWGSVLYGVALLVTAAWLTAFDIARRTLRTRGFARYAACALLAGYGWLAVGGVAWIVMPWLGPASRDVALHAVALGFVVSMIFAHAPRVVPVILRAPMRYTALLYAPLALLHASLVVRLVLGFDDALLRQRGGWLNAVALVVFAGTMLAAVLRKRRGAGQSTPPR